MTAPQVLQFTGAESVRVVDIDGRPWFIAADVCSILGLGNPRSSVALLDEDEKGVHSMDTLGGEQTVSVVNEPGLYSLIFRSRKPEAKVFKRWIAWEVLPAIHRYGFYSRNPEDAVLNYDEVAAQIREAVGIDLTVTRLIKLMKVAGILKQGGAPTAKYRHLFRYTGTIFMLWREHFRTVLNKVCATYQELRESQFVQARLEGHGFAQLELPSA